jgi:hypothetical protein
MTLNQIRLSPTVHTHMQLMSVHLWPGITAYTTTQSSYKSTHKHFTVSCLNYNFLYYHTKIMDTLHGLHAFLQAYKAYFIYNFPKINQDKILL